MIVARPAVIAGWLHNARRLEWAAFGLRAVAAALLYATLGHIEALTAVWLHTLWGLLPPLAFLFASWLEQRPPTPRFPLGFYRANGIAFWATSLTLTTMGLYLAGEACHELVAAKAAGMATFSQTSSLAGWGGWPMLAALAYTAGIPLALGRPRTRLARALNDRGLYADAATGYANWLAAGAAAIGVVGLGLGLWWADAVATLIIGGIIIRLGARHVYTATCDLMDELPRRLGSRRIDPVVARLKRHLESQPWVDAVDIGLRTHGRMLVGFARVTLACDSVPAERLRVARTDLLTLDWRLLDIYVIPESRADARRNRSPDACQD